MNAPQLLADLTRQLKRLEDDLRQRIGEQPDLNASLRAEWQAARDADRCAETFETWAEQVITQAGVHWLLSCVFLRFIEDNQLVDRPWLGGTPESGRLALARDRHESYFQTHPLQSDRDYLLASFREASVLPGLRTFFDEAHNPVFRIGISGDAAMALRQFWQQIDPNTGALAHDFTDATWNTRFLGDLYQDLSEATRKRYALLQTPEFVEQFILDRTLTPAIRTFGFRAVRMIDPTCGSGHFLLGGFHLLVEEWARHEPARNRRDMVQKALDAVAGVDLNPFAVAIARFRLLVAALKASEVRRLSEAPDFKLHVAIGDSLLHGSRFGMRGSGEMFAGSEHYVGTGLAHAYASEDLSEVQSILGRQYHAVVGNPPYITVKDAALNVAYRLRYASCYRQYSLGCPFTERFFEFAITGNDKQAGYVGLITTNSFMKREFGSRLVEQVLPRLDLTHVVDTSSAKIPEHDTPTVIIFGRHRAPVGDTVRTVMGIKGEPSTPDDPAQGLVWLAIVRQIDLAGSESEFISVADMHRATFAKHPWSLGGGGAGALKEHIESERPTLSAITKDLGFVCITKADDAFVLPRSAATRNGCETAALLPFGIGEEIRDWCVFDENVCLFPYDENANLLPAERLPGALRMLWPLRTALYARKVFGGQTYRDVGKPWYSYGQIPVERFKIKPAITFAFVSTHNHFAFDRNGKVFKQSAPVIKLPRGASEADHLGLLALLNSSVACFWMQQVLHNKGGPGGGSSKDEKWHDFYEFASTALLELPIARPLPMEFGRALDSLASQRKQLLPRALLGDADGYASELPTRATLEVASERVGRFRAQMIALQEELDWHCYHLYGLIHSSGPPLFNIDGIPPVEVGERAFEIAMARRVAAGQLNTRWFEWLGITPMVDVPAHWPEEYRRAVEARIALIESDHNIGLVESMACKRRWETPHWPTLEQGALRARLLDHLEASALWLATDDRPPQISSASRLAETLRGDACFVQVAELYAQSAGLGDIDLSTLVAELVAVESVPFLPVLRYKESGLRKRAQWEATWALQRREDAEEPVGEIPVPPDYKSADFIKPDFWRLRDGLDVPKERWISYPGCERGSDGSLVIAWAGWNHLQQATALAGYYTDMKDTEGWEPTRLQPMLAGLLELVPWLEQWHNDLDPVFGERMGTYYKGFVTEEARALGFTLDDLRAWKPAVVGVKRGRKKAAAASEG